MGELKLFVTVGTTKFDSLIRKITSPEALRALTKLGFKDVVLQIGRGEYEPSDVASTRTEPRISYFRLKDSIATEIAQADLIVSHAGAGSIIDSLGARKSVLVVVNEELMGNHQTELAEKLAGQGHLHFCGVSTLVSSLLSFNFQTLKPFPPGEPSKFAEHLDKKLQFSLT